MNIIYKDDISCEDISVVENIFSEDDIKTETIEAGLACAAVHVHIPFKTKDSNRDIVVVIWSRGYSRNDILQFRVVLFDQQQREKLQKNVELWEDLEEEVDELNCCSNMFGSLSLSSIVGIAIDYSLSILGGMPEHAIVNTAREVAEYANWVNMLISSMVEDSADRAI